MRFGLFFAFQVIPMRGAYRSPSRIRDLLECLPRAEELGYESIFTASPRPARRLVPESAASARGGGGADGAHANRHRSPARAALCARQAGRGRRRSRQPERRPARLRCRPGYVSEEFLAHGVPREERVSRMEEALDLMQTAWMQERFSFRGRFYAVEPETELSPKPIQMPHPRSGTESRRRTRFVGPPGGGPCS